MRLALVPFPSYTLSSVQAQAACWEPGATCPADPGSSSACAFGAQLLLPHTLCKVIGQLSSGIKHRILESTTLLQAELLAVCTGQIRSQPL